MQNGMPGAGAGGPPTPGPLQPIGPTPTWAMIVGAVFGAITLIGLFVFAFLSSTNPAFVCNSFSLLAPVFSLGAALAAGFIGGGASAQGQFGDVAQGKSFAFAAGGGVAVLIIVFFLFQYFKPDNCIQRNVTIRGSLTYSVPEPRNSDLIFTFAGPENQVIYTSDTGHFEKLFLYAAEFAYVEIIVRNRPLYKICSERGPTRDSLNTRSTDFQTIYKLHLTDAYTRGVSNYNLNFEYKPLVPGSHLQDQLVIKDLGNIDPKHLKWETQHFPEDCLVESEESSLTTPRFVVIAGNQGDNNHTIGATNRWFISAALAQETSEISDDLIKLLDSNDKSLSEKAKITIGSSPDKYLNLIGNIFSSGNKTQIINVLDALKRGPTGTYRLPDNYLKQLLSIATTNDQAVWQAVRNYLLDRNIVDTRLADLAAEFLRTGGGGTADGGPLLNLLFLTRDIYYNAAYKAIVRYRGNYGSGDRDPAALQDSIHAAKLGAELIAQVPADNNVNFAKAYYVWAFALYSEAVVTDAEQQLGRDASSKTIEQYIINKAKQHEGEIPFTPENKIMFKECLDRFFALVGGREAKYLWPDHIRQLRACAQFQYSCIYYN